MNGSNINYSQHMSKAHQRLARCAFSKLAVTLMDEGSVLTLDLCDDLEDEILDFGKVDASRALWMRDTLTEQYRAEFTTSARLSTIQIIAAIPGRLAQAQLEATREFY